MVEPSRITIISKVQVLSQDLREISFNAPSYKVGY